MGSSPINGVTNAQTIADAAKQAIQELEDLIDSIGYQKMLANQPIATRFSAVKREIVKQKVWK